MAKWQPKVGARIAIGVVGLLVTAIGWGAWALETEYGGNAPSGATATEEGLVAVFDYNEQAMGVDPEDPTATSIVFVGTEAEAQAYMDQRWREGRNYLVEGAIIAVGVLMIVAAIIPTGALHRRTTAG